MKKVFWIAYAVIFITVVIVGYMLLKNLKEENEDLKVQNEGKWKEIERIKIAMAQGTLPNKIWPDVYKNRCDSYLNIKQRLNIQLASYNMRLHQPFANTPTGLFDGEFKKRWILLLKGLLKDGFTVSSSTTTPK